MGNRVRLDLGKRNEKPTGSRGGGGGGGGGGSETWLRAIQRRGQTCNVSNKVTSALVYSYSFSFSTNVQVGAAVPRIATEKEGLIRDSCRRKALSIVRGLIHNLIVSFASRSDNIFSI